MAPSPATAPVVFVPSLGRPGSDFDVLVEALVAEGFEAFAIDPPASMPGEPTLHALVAEIITELDSSGIAQAHLVGHAFGNRVVRCVVADRPERVRSMTLLAAGGAIEIADDMLAHLWSCFDKALPPDEHLAHVQAAFFAPGNDPSPWRKGWKEAIARYQSAAVQRTNRDDWWDAVADPTLIIQGLQDVIAVPENGRRFHAAHPDVTQLVEIDGAGHALVPEQPDAILAALVPFLRAAD